MKMKVEKSTCPSWTWHVSEVVMTSACTFREDPAELIAYGTGA
jgi:hypothetical protein